MGNWRELASGIPSKREYSKKDFPTAGVGEIRNHFDPFSIQGVVDGSAPSTTRAALTKGKHGGPATAPHNPMARSKPGIQEITALEVDGNIDKVIGVEVMFNIYHTLVDKVLLETQLRQPRGFQETKVLFRREMIQLLTNFCGNNSYAEAYYDLFFGCVTNQDQFNYLARLVEEHGSHGVYQLEVNGSSLEVEITTILDVFLNFLSYVCEEKDIGGPGEREYLQFLANSLDKRVSSLAYLTQRAEAVLKEMQLKDPRFNDQRAVEYVVQEAFLNYFDPYSPNYGKGNLGEISASCYQLLMRFTRMHSEEAYHFVLWAQQYGFDLHMNDGNKLTTFDNFFRFVK